MSQAQVVFFGAGEYAQGTFEASAKKYAPVAYGDNDIKKHGTTFMGLPVMSLDQLEARYPGCRYYLTVNVHAKPYLMESLCASGVEPSRIINYEDFKRYTSCQWLEASLSLASNGGLLVLKFCCRSYGKNVSPRVNLDGKSCEEALLNLFTMRDRVIEELNQQAESDPQSSVPPYIPPELLKLSGLPAEYGTKNPCLGCCNVKDGLWLSNRRIRFVGISHRAICNFRCSYCSSKAYIPTIADSRADADAQLAFMRFLKKNGHIDADTRFDFGAGEILIHPRRDEILVELMDYDCWIYTNASAYSEKIGELLSRGKSRLCPSIDAGTRATFAKIKGVDVFDKVCENLARYSLDGFVHLKYIVMPGLNDNDADIAGFIDLCGRLKIKAVDISRAFDLVPFGDYTIDAVARMMNELQGLGVKAALLEDVFSGTPEDSRIKGRLTELKGMSWSAVGSPPGGPLG
jgi:pyruvate-formate lyase-activating enzyme